MTTSLTPWKAASAVVSLSMETPGWNLAEVVEGEPLAARTFTTHIDFSEPFQFVPVMHSSLVGFDIDRLESQRVSVALTGVTTTGFDLAVTTWMASRVYSVEVSWLALGS